MICCRRPLVMSLTDWKLSFAGATECCLTAVKEHASTTCTFRLILPTLCNKERTCKHDQRSDEKECICFKSK